jgi:hypothetical protein
MEAIAEWRAVSEPLFVKLKDEYAAPNNRTIEKAVEDERDQAFNRLVRRILESVEHLALGVRTRAYDDTLVFELARGWIDNAWTTFLPYIKRKRIEAGTDTIYEHFEWLAKIKLPSMTPAELPDRPLVGELPDPRAKPEISKAGAKRFFGSRS